MYLGAVEPEPKKKAALVKRPSQEAKVSGLPKVEEKHSFAKYAEGLRGSTKQGKFKKLGTKESLAAPAPVVGD